MPPVLNWLLIAVGIAGMFLLLIAPHEGGHFLVAKLFKVRVIEFSIGAGTQAALGHPRRHAVRPRHCPSSATCGWGAMEAGDFDEPNGFHSKHPAKRIAILAAGPAANFLVAMISSRRMA